MDRRTSSLLLIVAVLTAACDGSPAAPTPSPGPMPRQDARLTVESVTFQGWLDGQFFYRPSLIVSAVGDYSVSGIEFTDADSGTRLYGVSYPTPLRLTTVSFKQLLGNWVLISSSVELVSVNVKVTATNAANQDASISKTVAVPPIPKDATQAVLSIDRFTVKGWFENGLHYYWPRLELRETAGLSEARIHRITFKLVDGDPSGNGSPYVDMLYVRPNGTLILDEDPYWNEPWMTIDTTAPWNNMSVVISFTDDHGRGGSVSAMALVAR